MRTAIIVIATAVAVYEILRLTGVFEFTGRHQKVVTSITATKKKARKKQFETAKLGLYSWICNTFRGILLPPSVEEDHDFYIKRLDIRSEILDRQLKPEELRGKYATPLFFSLILLPIAVFQPMVLAVNVGCVLYLAMYPATLNARIRDEDEVISNNFLDLYLLMYSNLKQGSRARIQGVLQNYIDTLGTVGNVETKRVMLKFAQYFLNLLSLYEDHVAVPMLKDVYRSAVVINFCNVATQSLNGIENFDNLLTFKMQLVERKTNIMRKNSLEIVKKGERSIYAVYAILFIFIVVGWYSKLPTGFF